MGRGAGRKGGGDKGKAGRRRSSKEVQKEVQKEGRGSWGGTRAAKKAALASGAVRRGCDPEKFAFQTTEELKAPKGMLGQKRALEALRFGLDIRKKGYHVFVAGPSGAGKLSSVRRLLRRRAAGEPTPRDICYIHSFEEPSRPKVLCVPSGMGRRLSQAMGTLVEELDRRAPQILSSRLLATIRASLGAECRVAVDEMREELFEEAQKEDLWIQQEGQRFVVAPLVDGEPLGPGALEGLPSCEVRGWEEKLAGFGQLVANFERRKSDLERETEEFIREEERAALTPYVDEMVGEMEEEFAGGGEAVACYLEAVRRFVLENHRKFLPPEDEDRSEEESGDMVVSSGASSDGEGAGGGAEDNDLVELKINVLVDRHRKRGAPVVFEGAPTPAKLLGCLEYRDTSGTLSTDHTLIRPGALHRADGGYLVLQSSGLESGSAVWSALQRTIDRDEIHIDENREEGQSRVKGTVTPEPFPLDVKVVIIGTGEDLDDLGSGEAEFDRMFKVKVDFEETFPRNKSNELRLARFISKVCNEEGYRHFDAAGVAEAVEFCARVAEDARRLSTRLAYVVDLITEADYWAGRSRAAVVSAQHVREALERRRERRAKTEEQIMDDICEGQLLIDMGGAVVGQVNGISVYELGDYSFGVPCRITASTYVGRGDVMHIDREVKLSGALHDKGALILVGLLGGRYAQSHRLALSASVTFEQNYEEVEGDSASAAELFALLSSLSGVPIRQEVAVTGSVNQRGELQPIGAVNEKIEGVFRTFLRKGLTGDQGVLIPWANAAHLMVHPEVVVAVRDRRFHVWAVKHVGHGHGDPDRATSRRKSMPGFRRASGRRGHGATRARTGPYVTEEQHSHRRPEPLTNGTGGEGVKGKEALRPGVGVGRARVVVPLFGPRGVVGPDAVPTRQEGHRAAGPSVAVGLPCAVGVSAVEFAVAVVVHPIIADLCR